MPVYEYDKHVPYIHPRAMVHPDAHICGDVWIGPVVIVMAGASLRGDFGRIRILESALIMDGAVLHNLPGVEVVIESGAVVGRRAVVHSATVRRESLVGDRVVLLDESVLGAKAMITDGSLLTGGTKVPPGRVACGTPATLRGPSKTIEIQKLRDKYAQLIAASWPDALDKQLHGNALFSGRDY